MCDGTWLFDFSELKCDDYKRSDLWSCSMHHGAQKKCIKIHIDDSWKGWTMIWPIKHRYNSCLL